MPNRRHKHKGKLGRDALLVLASILGTILLVRLGAISHLLSVAEEYRYIGSFVAGIFFTSILTIAPASVALAELAQTSPFAVALWGALGAMLGDLLIFLFIRDSLAEDIIDLLKAERYKRITHLFRLRLFRRLTPFVGALIIASPLPDELGLAMMGLSKTNTKVMLPVSFVMNFIGILLAALVARAL